LRSLSTHRQDFEGQKLVENIAKFTLIAASVFAFLLGLALQSLKVTFVVFGVVSALLFVVVLPPWPMFNRHPVKWLPAKESNTSS
ncbi:microsomal signal peptidase, partial [Fomitopsis schrenkii]